jgi:hypothetical protein
MAVVEVWKAWVAGVASLFQAVFLERRWADTFACVVLSAIVLLLTYPFRILILYLIFVALATHLPQKGSFSTLPLNGFYLFLIIEVSFGDPEFFNIARHMERRHLSRSVVADKAVSPAGTSESEANAKRDFEIREQAANSWRVQ